MFDNTQTIEATAGKLAEEIAVEDDTVTKLDREVKDRKSKLNAAKEKLATLLIQNGLDSIKLASGLQPRATVTRKFFKAAGVTDEELHTWLRQAGLGAIIKETVHFGTLNSTMKEYEQSAPLPEIIQVAEKPTIRMNGKTAFLAARNAEVTGHESDT
jgi:hypothetical protein